MVPGAAGVKVGASVGVNVCVGVSVSVTVEVCVGVGVMVDVGVEVKVGVGVIAGVNVDVPVGTSARSIACRTDSPRRLKNKAETPTRDKTTKTNTITHFRIFLLGCLGGIGGAI